MPLYLEDRAVLHLGSNLSVLDNLEPFSVDAVVTDPPYGLKIVGNKWDYSVPSVAFWFKVFHVLKSGGHVISFSSTRTYHRMVCNLEDAGFEIRDMLSWIYSSGYPKNSDVSRLFDARGNGNEGLLRFTAWLRTTGITAKQINDTTQTSMASHYLTSGSQPAVPTREIWSKLRPLCAEKTNIPPWVDELIEQRNAREHHLAKREVVETRTRLSVGDQIVGRSLEAKRRDYAVTLPYTEEAKRWHGWGTALRPSQEPIVLARKPLDGNITDNIQLWGTGAINIDDCRNPDAGISRVADSDVLNGGWPSNVFLEDKEEVLSLVPNGNAKRFFFCSKTSKQDREEGCHERYDDERQAMTLSFNRKVPYKNTHPTVKPTSLMRWLCRLVTPPNGIILDPYMGSGSTGKAALLEGFRFVGIEMDQNYFVTAHDRISWALKQHKEGKQDEVGYVDQEEGKGDIEQAGEEEGSEEGEELA